MRLLCCFPVVEGVYFNSLVATVRVQNWKYFCFRKESTFLHPQYRIQIVNSYSVALSADNTEPQSSILLRREGDWPGPLGLCGLYHIKCWRIFDLPSFKSACLRSGATRYVICTTYSWRFEVDSVYDDWDPSKIPIRNCLSVVIVSINSSRYF